MDALPTLAIQCDSIRDASYTSTPSLLPRFCLHARVYTEVAILCFTFGYFWFRPKCLNVIELF